MKHSDTLSQLKKKVYWYSVTFFSLIALIIILAFNFFEINRLGERARVSLLTYSRFTNRPELEASLPDFISGDFCVIRLDEKNAVASVAFSSDNHFIDEEGLAEVVETAQKGVRAGMSEAGPYHYDKELGDKAITVLDKQGLEKDTWTCIGISVLVFFLCLLLFLFISRPITSWIIRPAEDAFLKQKQFIADCSHELKTPLSAIRANADLLEIKWGTSKELEHIQRETEDMGLLITDLLSLSRLGEVNDRASFVSLDLGILVENVCIPLEALMEEKMQKLERELPKGIMIRGNKRNLQQLVSILLDNAGRNAPEKSTVTVTLKKERNHPVLSVTNKGDPIDRETKDHIFDRFYQADPEHSARNNFGLGLAIAKGIVTTHEATIDVQSNAGFVSFFVTFPA